jgi:hypothetical protein
MAVNLVSPGVKIREVDLTIGRIDLSNDQVGAFAGPFSKGPVELPILIQNEQELLDVFGKPKTENGQNTYWLSASNYLSYGGILQVVRSDSSESGAMYNAYSPVVGIGSTANLKIKSVEDYNNKTSSGDTSLTKFYYSAKNPGTWANNLKVYVIDAAADQIVSGINTQAVQTTSFISGFSTTGSIVGSATSITGITTSGVSLGDVVVCDVSGIIPSGTTVVGINSAVGIGTDFANTIILSAPATSSFGAITAEFDFGSIGVTTTGITLNVGYGVSISIANREYAGVGQTDTFSGYLKGIITGIGQSLINVKLISRYSDSTNSSEYIDYSENNPLTSIQNGDIIKIINPSGGAEISTYTSYTLSDWYNSQTVDLGNSTAFWKNLAERPGTSQYVQSSGGKNDEVNVIVIDTEGKVNGNAGEILEKFTKLSKAKDGKITPSQSTYYLEYIRDNSSYLFVGEQPNGAATKFAGLNNYNSYSGGSWGSLALNSFYTVIGNTEYSLDYGTDYTNSGTTFGVGLSDIIDAYSVFANPTQYEVNYIINGPSGGNSVFESQAKANYIVSLAEARKDCIAVVSPHEDDVINQSSSTTQTNNIIKFFNGVSSSTYAVFDSGYKYTYDRFNNKFLYIPCNSDIAGLMARTSINQYPWFSPAGATRGILNNAIKLAYSPSEAQRDLLYTNRINPIIIAPGQGIMLYGDKTASAYVSAFDRINVRRLFLTIERTIEKAARSQLFEFNDAITRGNFVNIVEPYLRDVRAKRGITEFLVICDESNNTPDVIDANQFRADIYIKPARSINFINLTFVATRTGVSFSEIVGTV